MYRLLLTVFIAGSSLAQTQDTISVYFDVNSSQLDHNALNKLEELSSMDVEIIRLEGRCDTTGSVSYNKKLAQRRLNSVKEKLKLSNTNSLAIGESTSPILNNYIPEKERRVDIIYRLQIVPIPMPEPSIRDTAPPSKLVSELSNFVLDTNSNEIDVDLSILFYSNTDTYYPECEVELWELFDFLHYNQNVTAHIMGHVCCADDYDLSSRRAYKVYMFLVKRSIARDRLTFKGYSNKRPKVHPEVTDEDRRLNRRVNVVFTKH